MIFLPTGFMAGEVCDPAVAMQDFQEAARRANDLNAWSFEEGALGAQDIAEDAKIQVSSTTEPDARLGITPGAGPTLPNDGGADADLWNIPRNSLQVVGSTNPGATTGGDRVTWTATVPEMVICFYTYQYARYGRNNARWSTYFNWGASIPFPQMYRNLRVTVRLRLDGVEQEGTGAPGAVEDGIVRGTGSAERTIAAIAH